LNRARRLILYLAFAAALSAQRPHWDRVRHFVFILLPRAGFDQYFGAFPDSEGRPGAIGSREVPNYWAYAELYTLQDHFFSVKAPAALLRAQTTRLDAAGVAWKDYSQNMGSFVEDCRNESLPAVSFLLPEQLETPEMAYLTTAVNAVAGSRLWRRSAVFAAWASAGDSPDHMALPGFGGRVPSLVIGPWARLAYNDHRAYSHLSWVRSIENRFGLPSSGDTAADLYDPFDFAQQPRDPVILHPDGAGSYPVAG
jgi:phospholipase C